MQSPGNQNRDLLRYAGLATQMFVVLGVGVFIGIKLDKWLNTGFPILVWTIPLVIIIALIYKLIKETGTKK